MTHPRKNYLAHTPQLYVMLFHGRKRKNEDLDNWGSDGPILGPFHWVHTTYGGNHKLGHGPEGDTLGELYLDDDLIYYDGVWYGDWSVITHLDGLDRKRVATFELSKSTPPGVENFYLVPTKN